jgi:hypothetical protein
MNLEFTGNFPCIEKTQLACLTKCWEKEKENKKNHCTSKALETASN